MPENISIGLTITAAMASGFRTVFSNSVSQIVKLGKTVKDFDAQLNQVKGLQKLETGIEQTAAELTAAKRRVDYLREGMAKAGNQGAALFGKDLEKAKAEVLKLSSSLDKQKGKLAEHREAAKAAGLAVDDLRAEEVRLGAALDKNAARYKRLQSIEQQRADNRAKRADIRGQVFDVVALGATVAAPVKAAIDFESTMADVQKVVNFDTPEQFKAMQRDILGMSRVMPMAADQIGQIIATAAQSNIARDELQGFARDAIQMGVAFDLAGDQAGSMMSDWRAGMNLNQQRTVALADAVNHLSNNMNARAGDLGMVIQRQGAVAMTAGLAENQVASLGAALLSSGTSPEIAATALKNLTGALTKGTAATATQQAAMSELGFTATELAMRMQEDAQGAILEVFDALAQAPAEQRGALASQLFGEESKGAIVPLLTNLGNLRKAFELTADSQQYLGSMQAEYEQRAKTSANNVQLFRNQVNALGVTLGNVLLPAVNGVLGALGSMATGLADLAEEHPVVTQAVIWLAGGLVLGKVAALGLKFAFTLLVDAWLFAAKSFDTGRHLIGKLVPIIGRVTTAVRAMGIAFMANPAGLVIGAIVLSIAALGAAIYRYWEPIKAFFGGMWDGFAEAMGPVFDALSPLGDVLSMIGDALGVVVGWFGNLFEPVNMANEELAAMAGTGKRVGEVIGSVFRTLMWPLTAASEAIGWIGEAWNSLFGDDEDEAATKARARAERALRSLNEVQPAFAGAGGGNITEHQSNQFTIVQQPGEDGEALAERVAEKLERRRAVRRRGSMWDAD